MKNCDVLIIGAGAAGLMAARTLAKVGKKVTVLEARERSGGRIYTLNNELFFKNAELGAEFVHGDLPVTLNLLKEAGIGYHPANAEMWHYKNGEFDNEGGYAPDWDLMLQKLNELTSDISIEAFLENEFAGDEHEELRKWVRRFVSGYDTADPQKASAFALRKEWTSEDDHAQHRVEGGYSRMIKYLEDECKKHGGYVLLNSTVKEIKWDNSTVQAITDDGSVFEGCQLLIALPLGVLQAAENEMGAINFIPAITDHTKAVQAMGFGAIIKILLEFDEPFWESDSVTQLAGKSLKPMGFLLSEEEIPTWWTQVPEHSHVLTGWLGGKPAERRKDSADAEILQEALQSLSNIFKISPAELKDKLVAFNIANWTNDPFNPRLLCL